jgi:type 2 lantibiotic biosynthesis protein LanM
MTVVMQVQERLESMKPERTPSPAAPLRAPGLSACMAVAAPMITAARDCVRRGAQRLANRQPGLFDPVTVEACLAANLAEPLVTMTSRVMALELNVARLEGVLTGSTPEARFTSFVERLSQPEVAEQFWAEYSVLRDQIVQRLDNWATFSLRFLDHLCSDWISIRDCFLGNDTGPIVRIDGGAGDTHRKGSSVAIVSFESGARIVYKPRSLATEVHFQQLLAWLNARGAQPEFRILGCLDREDRGWAEYIAAEPCRTLEELPRFYRRQGAYLAVLYALHASDFHCENLIAAGEHPVLIDLEALFQPRLAELEAQRADELAVKTILDGVLRVGLLPMRFWDGGGHDGIDMSGMGSAAGQLSPMAVPQWEEVGTDQMHLVRKRVTILGSDNRPSLNSAEVDPLDYTAEIAAGFESTYRLLLRHRSELREIVARFLNDEVRVIPRATQTYGTILRESFHPDLLRNPADRLAFLDRLREAVEFRPCLHRLVDFERDDLLRADIPLFTTTPSSLDVWSSTGETIENYFEEPGAALVERRIDTLNEADLERQLWMVRASLATMSSRAEGPSPALARHLPLKREATKSELVSAACAIGDRLEDLVLRSGDEAAWIGLVPASEHTWQLAPLGLDLYDGIPGVALFLAQLEMISGERRFRDLAKSAVAAMRRQLEGYRSNDVIGGFTGWGGVLYALSNLGTIWADTSLIDEAESSLSVLAGAIPRDTVFDVIGGAAGCALGLRALYECRRSPRLVELGRTCGDHLLANAQSINGGLGWLCGSHAVTPLTGFAHGSAGIGHALLAVAALTGDARYREGAASAFTYERALYSADRANWPDLRNNATKGFVTAWCHGAPGIGLSRLFALSHFQDDTLMQEIDAALTNTRSHTSIGNHSLCHGDLGNADVLLTASQVARAPELRRHANRMAAAGLEVARKSGWICGNPLGVESPGLMTGISGIGYALLRLAEPARIPSILALQPPVLS